MRASGLHIEITTRSPLPARFGAYLRERFPLLAYGILIVSFYSSNQFLAHALAAPNRPMHYDLGSLMGAVTLLLLFFHLRVFDDHKDFAHDSTYYPERTLQRGVISRMELKRLAAVAIAGEVLLAAAIGPAPLLAVLAAIGYSWLMLREFFIGPWLKRHFLLYASIHMLIIPLLAIVVFSFATGQWMWQAPGWFWLYSFVGFFVAFNWEISRKIRSPEQEREGIDSYTKLFGTYGAAYLVLLVRIIDTALVAVVGFHLGLGRGFYLALAVLFAGCALGVVHYRLRTSARTAARMQTYASIYVVAFDITLAVAIAWRFQLELPLPW